MALRILFFGTPAFAVPSLEAVTATSHPIVGVVTQPDRPRGRGHKVTASPVKQTALALSIPVFQPDRLKDSGAESALTALAPDLGVVVAYGKILPAWLLALPRLGMINVHASLLPRWRGAAPIHRAIMAGDQETGVTIMRVVQALDAGPMLASFSTPIDSRETSVELEERLARLGAHLLVESLEALARGPVRETPQDEALVTYAARIERKDGQIDFARPATVIHNAIRGLHPWPLVSVTLNGRRLALLASDPRPDETADAAPGTIIRIEPEAIVVAASPGAVRLTRLQLEGRAPVSAREFLNGHPVHAGERLEPVGTATR